MTTPSNFSVTGIAVYAEQPLWGAGNFVRLSLNPWIETYSHTIAANGGYESASITLKLTQGDIEEWLENGLGRHIAVYNEGGSPIWEGFVNDIEAKISGLTAKRGPLMAIANRVRCVYSTVDTTVTPPAVGIRAKTTYSNDTDSQRFYGIIERILSAGGATEADIGYIQETYIAENSRAETTPTQIVIGGSGDLTITLNCRGYYDWLNAYTYNSTTTTTTTISTRIQAVLTADPNSIISTDYARITANTAAIPAYEQDDPLAGNYIMGLVAMGDTAYNRYTFGIYANRVAYYTVMPTTQTYVWYVGTGGELRTIQGAVVRPWDAMPARWAQIPDFMIGRVNASSAMRDDPRYMFIESLTYTAPYSLTLNGAKVSKLPQILGQLGLMGIGA